MTPVLALWLAAYLLAVDGVAALVLAGILGAPGALAVGLALVGGLVARVARVDVPASGRLGRALVVVAALASLVDLLYLAETVLDGLVHLLLFLVVARLWTMRAPGEARVVAFLSFFMLVAASSAGFGVSFLFVFLAYLLLATWLLLLQHVLAESAPGPRRTVVGGSSALGSPRALLVLAVAASAATLAITAVLFFVIPRVGLAALPFRGRMGPMVTGFADRVELGSYGQIQTDESIAMRVHVPDGPAAPDRIPNLRWRGIVFDEYDGQAWSVGQPERLTLRRAGIGQGDFRVGVPRGRGAVLYHEVYLEPIGTDVIFAAPRALRVTLRSSQLTVDDMGSLSVASPSARLHYIVESELPEGPLAFPLAARGLEPGALAATTRYLQLPRLPARIADLAREVTAGSRTPYDAAVTLSDYLAREYRYTLTLERRTTLDPVDEFLFVRKAGNCEYFAAALAVMLRTLGVPSRVVGGFQRGEWNPYGRYFTVRMRDAHSWVEAFVPGAGWVTLDPTPRAAAEAETAGSEWGLYLDALRMRWYRYVINWSLRDQVEVATSLRRQAGAWRLSLDGLPSWRARPAWLWPAAAGGLVAVVAWLALRRPRAPDGRRAVARMPRFYEQALRRLARQGLRPSAGETAREFSARVAGAAPGRAAPFDALTTAYERARFGGVPLAPGEMAALAAHLAALSRDPASTRG